MARISRYSKKDFTSAAQLLSYDPSSGVTALVPGQTLIDFIGLPDFNEQLINRVQWFSTNEVAKTENLPEGRVIYTAGNTDVADGGGGHYIVVGSGEGSIVLDNGNELLLLPLGDLTGSDATNADVTTATDTQTVAGAVDSRVINLDSVQQFSDGTLSMANLSNGQKILLAGYHPGSIKGGGPFKYNSSRAKSDHDGVLVFSPTVPWTSTMSDYVDAVGETDGAGTGVLERVILDEIVTPYMGGAIGDDVTDDYASLRAVNLCGVKNAIYPSQAFYSSNTVPFASFTNYMGVFDGAEIRSDTDNQPVGASQAWLSAEGVAPTGRLYMQRLTFRGDTLLTGQRAFVLHDYYSTLDHITGISCGGGGIQLTQQKNDATVAAGNLVENKLFNPIVRFCGGKLLDLGEADNNKLTDGYCMGAILQGQSSLTTQHLFCGSAAGWQIDGLHCYGSVSDFTVQIQNSNNTRLTDFFIESFRLRGVSAEKTQGDLVISGQFNADNADSGAHAVLTGISGSVPNISVDVDIAVSLDVATSGINCYFNDALPADVKTKIRTQGSQKSLLTPVNGTTQSRIDEVSNIFGRVYDHAASSSALGLSHEQVRVAYGENSGRISGNSPATVTVPIKLTNFEKVAGTITIEANSFDNGGNLARYHGMFFVSAKTNGTDAWVSTLTTIITPTGFSAAPSISATNTSGDDGTIDVSFTFTDSASTGVVTVAF